MIVAECDRCSVRETLISGKDTDSVKKCSFAVVQGRHPEILYTVYLCNHCRGIVTPLIQEVIMRD